MNSAIVLKLKKELEQKNQELLIESALERVRTVAMAMKKPQDMLDVCRIISKELEGLGVKDIRNIQTAIVNEEKAVYLNYEYFRLLKKTSVTTIAYKGNKDTNTFQQKMLKDPEGFFTKSFNGQTEISKWIKYQAISGQYIDPHLKKAKSLHYYFYSIGPGALGISTYAALNKKDISLFKRFRNAFQLSYQRFIDIQKAETQAREAQIEAALERVRGKALAMHKSDELHGVVTALKKELMGLDIPGIAAATIYLEQDDGTIRVVDFSTGGSEESQDHIKLDKVFRLKDTDPNLWIRRIWNGKEKYFVVDADAADFKRIVRWLYTMDPDEAKKAEKIILENNIRQAWLPTVKLEKGRMNIDLLQPPTPEIEQIMLKLGAGFDLAYRRFLDLQKAEAQARESQIQLALERVRARTMAMQKSDELLETSEVLFQQLEKLGQPAEQFTIGIINEEQRVFEISATFQGNQLAHRVDSSIDEPYMMGKTYNGWKERLKSQVVEIRGKDLGAYNRYRNKLVGEKKFPTRINPDESWVAHVAYFSHGMLSLSSKTRLPHESLQLLERFASVFDLTYTRFLDLKNAEAQAREARIEAALEKVRSRSLAMHRADELGEVITVIVAKLKELNFSVKDGVALITYIEGSKDLIQWMENPGFPSASKFYLPYFEHPILSLLWKSKEQGLDFAAAKWTVKENRSFLKHIFKYSDYKNTPQSVKDYSLAAKSYANYIAFQKYTSIFINDYSEKPLNKQEIEILKRFSKVFEQAYIRFLDLQKAEAQTKEARIEAALEKVRARAMAMQKSDELQELITTVYAELIKLDLVLDRCFISIFDPVTLGCTWWMAAPETAAGVRGLYLKYHDAPPYLAHIKAWEERHVKWVYLLEGDTKKKWDDFLFNETELSLLPQEVIKNMKGQNKVFLNSSFNAFGYLNLATLQPLTDDQFDIMVRFAKVFDLTYTRFNDLKQAEGQAREAQIEASLERVRSRTMAMHKSEEVMDVAGTLFEELQKLSFAFGASSIIIMDKDSGDAEYWIAGFSKNKFPESYPVKYFRHPYHDALLTAWKNGEKHLVYTLEGKEKKAYDKVLFSETAYRNIPEVEKKLMRGIPSVTFSIAFMKHGALHWGPSALSKDQVNALQRFAQVFEQAYTRFQDLKKSEANAREFQIEASLERVRAKALAMQQPEELSDVAQVLRNEMGALGIEELETASIYIHDNDPAIAECWYALKDPADSSKKMVAEQFELNLDDTWVGKEMKKFYLSNEKQTSILMQGSMQKEWIEYCYKHSPAFSGFYGENIPDRTYHLYKFSHGYLGAAAPGDISAESWKLLSRAASVFSLAYSRFKDLTQARYDLLRLKEEKQRAESALAELKSTQTQLIQSEKMASLGELTAGIAHEIQNPLNFVNNFSELSNELIAEMKDELAKGNKEDAMQIVESVKQNLEKINFHGKRADAIVKSMLQHSRSSTGQKELTDINALADEYLRLAYHGFRVKDPSFNAKFEILQDDTIEKIKIVPQEIGRVFLNLINNAFYAVSEQKKENGPGYEPMVIVSIQKNNGNIEIKVKDNGNGMPDQVKEKIFQPFFTTKPAGQGTGLGLSLSYDIIKGHGGELKMSTQVGEGSEFVIKLPTIQTTA